MACVERAERREFLRRVAALLLLVLVPLLCAAGEAPAVKRFAWLLGEEAYSNNRLRTVGSDVDAMAAALRRAGWEVEPPLRDVDMDAVATQFSAFIDKMRAQPGAEVFVYLSGHGVERAGGANLRLIATPGGEKGRERGGLLPVSWLVKGLEGAGASLAVVVFDACREHDVAATEVALGWSFEPAAPQAPIRQLLLHATASGSSAEDGITSLGRFTRELIYAFQSKGTTVQEAFERARHRVWEDTDGRQRPEMVVASGPVLFARATPMGPTASQVPASSEQAITLARQLLGDARPAAKDAEERSLDLDISQALLLLFPPLATSHEKLERFAVTGSPGALLVLAVSLLGGDYGDVDLDRGRAIVANLQRSGIEERLLAMEQQGSPAASTALAVLDLALRRDNPNERLQRARAAAKADFLPAHLLHLPWSISVEGSRAGAAASERRLRALAELNDEPARWALTTARLVELTMSVNGKEPFDGSAVRNEILATLAPYRHRGIGMAVELSLRALFDPRLGPSMLKEADALCEDAWHAQFASAIEVCASTWTGDELARKDEAKALAWMRQAAALGSPSAANRVGKWLKEGYAGARDPDEAFRLFDACAGWGSVQCMVNAATALRTGQGTKRDVHRARALYEQAAQLGNNWADGLLADLLINEPELRTDDVTVRRRLLAGIENSYPEAWVTLGNALRSGALGLNISNDLARWAYAVGARKGSASATAHFCQMQVMDDDVEKFRQGKTCLEDMVQYGDVHARLILAHMLKYGIGLPLDERRAYALYEELVVHGVMSAAAMLGEFHEFGEADIPINMEMARSLYQRAADAGDMNGRILLAALEAHYSTTLGARLRAMDRLVDLSTKGHERALALLAQLKLTGPTDLRDLPAGLDILRLAAEAGSPWSQTELARRLRYGDGMATDIAQARIWFLSAATFFRDTYAMGELGLIDEFGLIKGTPDIQASREWYQRAAARGSGFGWAKLGHYAMNGIGEPVDTAKAVEHYERADAAGNPWGRFLLADALLEGRGVAVDRERALGLLRKAAADGQLDAQARLGYHLMGGSGFAPDVSQGMHWTRKAAEAGQADALNNLGVYLNTGRDGQRDTTGAVKAWRDAAARNNRLAMWNLYNFYLRGNGVAADAAEAESWLQAAAAAGHPSAVEVLARRIPASDR